MKKNRLDVFIQWKGTSACLDLNCSCGASSHFDGYFAHLVECPACGSVYEMPANITLKATTTPSYPHTPVVGELDDE